MWSEGTGEGTGRPLVREMMEGGETILAAQGSRSRGSSHRSFIFLHV